VSKKGERREGRKKKKVEEPIKKGKKKKIAIRWQENTQKRVVYEGLKKGSKNGWRSRPSGLVKFVKVSKSESEQRGRTEGKRSQGPGGEGTSLRGLPQKD